MDEIQTASETGPVQLDPTVTEGVDEREPASTSRSRSPFLLPGLVLAVGAVVALGLGFLVRTSEPRELPFPSFDARAVFPELTDPSRSAAETPSSPTSRFEAALQRAIAPSEAPPEEPPPRRAVPLGGDLVGEVPSDAGSWRWSSERGATLVLHQPPGGRPDALVYAEAFGEGIVERPAIELHLFGVTVDPEGDGGSPLLGAFARAIDRNEGQGGGGRSRATGRPARLAQLLATRTLGRGLGFTAAEDGFTGWRWVGRTEHRVAIRLARWEGTWREQRSLPAELARAVRDVLPEDRFAPSPERLSRVPAYLLMGSAAEPAETSGAHLAILCSRTPDCPVAAELAAFLGSIRAEPPGLLERLLREGLQEPFRDLASSAGIEVQQPTAAERPESEPDPAEAGS